MDAIIEKSLESSLSYQVFRIFVSKLAEEGKTSGEITTDEYIAFTKLNEARMHRLDKTLEITDEAKYFLENLDKDYLWLVLAESWCGDVAQVLPVINKMASVSSNIELRVVLRDNNEELMNQFLTNGTRSIPKLIIIDKETNKVVNHFGPRPEGAKQLILDYKAKHGKVDEPAKIELQKWYLADKGVSIQNEIIELMKLEKEELKASC